MSNSEANKRPISPSSTTEPATELVHFVSESSGQVESQPATTSHLAPASLVALPPMFASQGWGGTQAGSARFASAAAAALRPIVMNTSQPTTTLNAASAPFLHNMMMLDAPAIAQKREPREEDFLPDNCNDDTLEKHEASVAARRPCINRPIDHTYTDYAPVSDQELRMLDQSGAILNDPNISPEKRQLLKALKEIPTKAGGIALSFPSKLHAVISNPELSEIISWMPHGRAFVVHNPDALVSEVLPNYFNQTKFLSFIRQLNLWGFKRLTRGVEGKAYYHELFLRGRPYMTLRLKRHKVKGHGFKPVPNPRAEPNFHSFSLVGGLTPDEETKLKEECEELSKKQTAKKLTDSDTAAPSATQPSGLLGLENTTIKLKSRKHAATTATTDGSDSNFVASAISRPSVPLAVAAQSTLDVKPATRNPASQPEDPLIADALALLHYRQAAASLAENRAQTDAIVRARLAAVTGLTRSEDAVDSHLSECSAAARYAALGLNPYASFARTNMDDVLSQRLAQLQREQKEIEMLRRARMLEGLSVSHSNPFASGFPAVPRTSQAMTVADAIREAKQLEELASASRSRARILALAGAMESQSGCDGLMGNGHGQGNNEE